MHWKGGKVAGSRISLTDWKTRRLIQSRLEGIVTDSIQTGKMNFYRLEKIVIKLLHAGNIVSLSMAEQHSAIPTDVEIIDYNFLMALYKFSALFNLFPLMRYSGMKRVETGHTRFIPNVVERFRSASFSCWNKIYDFEDIIHQSHQLLLLQKRRRSPFDDRSS